MLSCARDVQFSEDEQFYQLLYRMFSFHNIWLKPTAIKSQKPDVNIVLCCLPCILQSHTVGAASEMQDKWFVLLVGLYITFSLIILCDMYISFCGF